MGNSIERFQFDFQKFKDVVHLVVDHVEREMGTEALGNTKLHKCLYYADILTYLDTMHPMTGADYQRQKFGPTARCLTLALDELGREGRVATRSVNYFGYSKKEYRSLTQPLTIRLSEAEVATILHVVDFVCRKSAVEISEFSHDEVWSSVPMGERIPYFAAFAMFPSVFTPDDIEDAEADLPALAMAVEAEERAGTIY